ncbi:MAG TPA: hypothetical protein VEG38_04160 [Acidimicrobiia bacterium]|nr:hypothetical protein [Acidimicrobiia bacterium]
MLAGVWNGVIDGDDWIEKRLKSLRERLAGDVPDEERQTLEAEIAALSNERGIMPTGFRYPTAGLWRRLRRRLLGSS